MIIGVGLLALVTQLFLFIRLTYVELSWDVMEPISYFVGVFNAILVYLYFMVYNRDFSFDDWSSRMQKHFWKRNIGVSICRGTSASRGGFASSLATRKVESQCTVRVRYQAENCSAQLMTRIVMKGVARRERGLSRRTRTCRDACPRPLCSELCPRAPRRSQRDAVAGRHS